MTGINDSPRCNGDVSEISIKKIVGDILRQARHKLPLNQYKKFEKEVQLAHEAFFRDKNAIIDDCQYDTNKLKETLGEKLKVEENESIKNTKEGYERIVHAKESCLRNKFNPAHINGVNTLKYFEYLATNPDEERSLQEKFEKDETLYMSFIRYALIQKREGHMKNKSSFSSLGGEKNIGVQWMNKMITTFSADHEDIDISKLDLAKEHSKGTENLEKEVGSSIGVVIQKDGTCNDKAKSKENFDKLMSGKKSISSFNPKQLGDLLSYVHIHSHESISFSGTRNENTKNFIKQLSENDPEGMITISEKWLQISTKLQVPAKEIQPLINDLIQEFGDSINSSIDGYFEKCNLPPEKRNKAKEDIQTVLKEAPLKGAVEGGIFNYIYNSVGAIIQNASGSETKVEKYALFIDEIIRKDYAHAKLQENVGKGKYPDIDNLSQIKNEKERSGTILKLKEKYTNDSLALKQIEAHEKEMCLGPVINSPQGEATKRLRELNKKEENYGIDKPIGTFTLGQTLEKIVANQAQKGIPPEKQNGVYNSIEESIGIATQAAESGGIDYLKNKDPKTLTQEEKNLLKEYNKSLSLVKREYTKSILNIDDAELKKLNIDTDKVDLSKSIKDLEKSVKTGEYTRSQNNIIEFSALKNGQTEQINLGTTGSGNTSENLEVSVTKVGDSISVKIGGQDTISLSQEQYPAYIESIKFLQDTGLGYLAKNLSPKDIQTIFRATSELGNTHVDNQDSTFGGEEQKLFLKNIARVLHIHEGMNQINTEDMKDYVRGKLQEKNFENRVLGLQKHWFKNQSINGKGLSEELKST